MLEPDHLLLSDHLIIMLEPDHLLLSDHLIIMIEPDNLFSLIICYCLIIWSLC